MAHDAAIVGLYILDVLGRPVTAIPAGGGVDFIEEIRLTVAGTAGGTVVSAAKLGLDCLAAGAVGEDEKADWVLATLEKHGVDVSMMRRIPGVPTSATILKVRPNGERPALHARGASDHFDLAPDDYDHAFDAAIVHLGGTGLLRALDGPRSVEILREAKARGRITTWDLIGARAETAEIVLPLLPYIDYFMPSIEEASVMCGLETPEEVAAFYLDRASPAACSPWAPRAPSTPTAMGRACARPPTTSRSWTPPAAATPLTRASSPRFAGAWTWRRACASPKRLRAWSRAASARTQASSCSSTRWSA